MRETHWPDNTTGPGPRHRVVLGMPARSERLWPDREAPFPVADRDQTVPRCQGRGLQRRHWLSVIRSRPSEGYMHDTRSDPLPVRNRVLEPSDLCGRREMRDENLRNLEEVGIRGHH